MSMRFHRRPATTLLACLFVGLAGSFAVFQTGCASNDSSYENPAPAISAFTTGTINSSNAFVPTEAGTTLQIPSGGSAWMRANFGAKNGTAVVTPGNIRVTSNVPFEVPNLTATTTFTLTVTSGDGQAATATTLVTVLTPPSGLAYANEDASYYAELPTSPNTPTVTGTTPMTFTVAPALPAGLAINATTGVISGTPQAPTAQTTYTVRATNSVGNTTRDIKIAVVATPLSFSVSPSAINVGGGAILTWDANQVVGSFSSVNITANPADTTLTGPFALAGTKNVSPVTTTTYTLSATPASGGAPVTRTVNVTVGTVPVAITSFTASPTATVFGGTTTLGWAYTGLPDTLTLDGTSVLGSTSQVVTPVRRQTFTLAGANTLGGDSRTVTVASRGLDLVAGLSLGSGMKDGTGGLGQFNQIIGMGADASGNLFVADLGNFLVRKITPAGVVTTVAGQAGQAGAVDGALGVNKLQSPRSLACDAYGNVIICDSSNPSAANNGKLRILKPDGTLLTVTAAPGDPNFATWVKSPNAFAIDKTASTSTTLVGWVVDYTWRNNGKMSIDLATGAATTVTASVAATPTPNWSSTSGAVVDPSGVLYVADTGNHCIRKVVFDGTTSTVSLVAGIAGTLGAPSVTNPALACLRNPVGIVWITNGTSGSYLYVGDRGNNAIRRITLDASGVATGIELLAGSSTGTVAGSLDGAGTAATFGGPQGIALVGSTLYAVDSGTAVLTRPGSIFNNTIRAMDLNVPANAVTTLAGTSRATAIAATTGSGDATGAAARFKVPVGVATDAQGNAYVADFQGNAIRKVDPKGVTTTLVGGLTGNPYAVAVDAAGNVYWVEWVYTTTAQPCVLKYWKQSDGSTNAITTTAALGTSVRGLTVNSAGTLLFLTDGNFVKQVDLGTAPATVTNSTFAATGANGVVVDASGGIYWTEFARHTVKYAASLTTVTASTVVIAGTDNAPGFDTTHLYNPVAIAAGTVNGHRVLFVSDQRNHAVRQIDLDNANAMTTLVGTNANGVCVFYGAGPGVLASGDLSKDGSLYTPQGVAVTPAGDVLVVTNDCLMQVTAP